MQRNFAKKLIESFGHKVHAFPSAEECMEFIENSPCDCIISDDCMPKMSGLDLLKLVKSRWKRMCFVMLTAVVEEDKHKLYIDAGIDAIMIKPLDKNILQNILNKI